MNIIRCVAIDDEPLALTILKEYVAKVPFLEMAEVFINPYESIQYLQAEKPDILFLDIQMPEILGIDFLRILAYKPIVILTTAYSGYALEGYNLDVTDYLLKPIPFERFMQAVNKALRLISPDSKPEPVGEKNFLFVKSGFKSLKVKFEEILYIEGLKEYVTIYTLNHKSIKLDTLKNLETILPNNKFIRVHKSYIVNIDFVSAYFGNTLEIRDQNIPVGRVYKDLVNQLFH